MSLSEDVYQERKEDCSRDALAKLAPFIHFSFASSREFQEVKNVREGREHVYYSHSTLTNPRELHLEFLNKLGRKAKLGDNWTWGNVSLKYMVGNSSYYHITETRSTWPFATMKKEEIGS
jgi:hypothetical protein